MPHLKNERGYQMRQDELFARLGLRPGHELPAGGMPSKNIDGTLVYILAKDPAASPKKQRVIAVCDCGKHVPFGKLHQHLKGNVHKASLAANEQAKPAPEWSGHPDPEDPSNFWIDDDTGERVNALTGERTPAPKSAEGILTPITRESLLEQHPIDEHGLIVGPGKFEREPLYVPYFHNMVGMGEVLEYLQDGVGRYVEVFDIDEDDHKMFPELGDDTVKVAIIENDQGFVSHELGTRFMTEQAWLDRLGISVDEPEGEDEGEDPEPHVDTALEEGTRMERAYGDGSDVG